MFQQSPVLEPVPDALLKLVELVPQPDHARADILAVAVDDSARPLGGVGGHRYADVAERVHRHRQDGLRVARCTEAGDAVAVEQRHHDARFDVRGRGEDDYRFHSRSGRCHVLTSDALRG